MLRRSAAGRGRGDELPWLQPHLVCSWAAMTILYFTLVAIVLYVGCDRLLDVLERRAGRRFEHRSLIFFGLLLGGSLVTFAAVRRFVGLD